MREEVEPEVEAISGISCYGIRRARVDTKLVNVVICDWEIHVVPTS